MLSFFKWFVENYDVRNLERREVWLILGICGMNEARVVQSKKKQSISISKNSIN